MDRYRDRAATLLTSVATQLPTAILFEGGSMYFETKVSEKMLAVRQQRKRIAKSYAHTTQLSKVERLALTIAASLALQLE